MSPPLFAGGKMPDLNYVAEQIQETLRLKTIYQEALLAIADSRSLEKAKEIAIVALQDHAVQIEFPYEEHA